MSHFMVMLILDDLDHAPDVFKAWEDAGVVGMTIIESTGLGRMKKHFGLRGDLPLLPSLSALLGTREERHRTIFTVVDNEELIDKLIDVTQEVCGDLNQPNKGVIFVLPVLRAIGINVGASEEQSASG